MRAGNQLDGVKARAVQPFRDGQHHAGGHVFRPEALMPVANSGVDESDSFRIHCDPFLCFVTLTSLFYRSNSSLYALSLTRSLSLRERVEGEGNYEELTKAKVGWSFFRIPN